jgi:integrase
MAGQILPRGDRKWLLRVYDGRDAAGKRIYINKPFAGSRSEAERELRAMLERKDTATLVRPSRLRVDEFMTEWLDTAATATVRPRTLRNYRELNTLYIEPTLGRERLINLTSVCVQRWVNELAARVSARTVQLAHAVLHVALERALVTGVLHRNVAAKPFVQLPQRRRNEMMALTANQVRTLLAAAEGDRWAPLWTLLVTTGIRPGEAAGLKWSDLDLEAGMLTVRRSLDYQAKTKWQLTEPKTPKATRSIPLSALALKALRDHRRRQAAERLAAGEYYAQHDFVFADPLGGPVGMRMLAQRQFTPLLRRAGLPLIRLYDLRHTAATILLATGLPVKVAQELLGHSSASMTLDVYSHVVPGAFQQAAGTMDRLLAGGHSAT